jgi:hypothetical protein
MAWLQDQIITPPAEAKTLASSDFCPHAMLGYGLPDGVPSTIPSAMRRAMTSGDRTKPARPRRRSIRWPVTLMAR